MALNEGKVQAWFYTLRPETPSTCSYCGQVFFGACLCERRGDSEHKETKQGTLSLLYTTQQLSALQRQEIGEEPEYIQGIAKIYWSNQLCEFNCKVTPSAIQKSSSRSQVRLKLLLTAGWRSKYVRNTRNALLLNYFSSLFWTTVFFWHLHK